MRTIFSCLVVMTLAVAVRGADQISISDARGDFSAGQYQTCLQKISRLLNMPEAKAGTAQRYDLFMLRGECMLQLKQRDLAADAFDAASQATKNEADLPRSAAAKATAVLIKASPGLKYQPKTATGSEPIDIIAQDSRRKAMQALLEDRLAEAPAQVDKAIKGTTLVPLEKLLPSLGELYALELTVTGDAKQALPLIKTVGEHARTLITTELDRVGGRVDELYELASEPVMTTGMIMSYRGTTTSERNELKDAIYYLAKIDAVCQEGRRINRKLGGSGELWDTLIADCDELMSRARKAFERKY